MVMKTKNYNHNFLISKKEIFNTVNESIKSNIDTSIIIPNACSTNIKSISKFSAIAYKKYPILYDNFTLNTIKKLGSTQFINVFQDKKNKNSIIFANMICQTTKPKNDRFINYGALALTMIDISSYCKRFLDINKECKLEIHSPKFGTGFSGGDWKTIANLIDDIWAENFITFIYEPNNYD